MQPKAQALLIEPSWKKQEDGTYTRPLLGSEASVDAASLWAEGNGEVCHGISFTTPLSDTGLIEHVREALLRLRFQSPLVAACIEGDGKTTPRSWRYTVAKSRHDAEDWCQHALKVQERAPPDEEFVKAVNETRLPYTSGSHVLFFACHLLLRDSGLRSVVFHGTHAIMDGFPTIAALGYMLGWISVPHKSYLFPVALLEWGSEWRSLPEGPMTATGGPQEGYKDGVEQLFHRLEETEDWTRRTPGKALRPQRSAIREMGRSVRVKRSIDSERSSALICAVKKLGFSVTVLFEAAQILATFADSDIPVEEQDAAHVTLDLTIIALRRHIVPPHDVLSRFVSAMVVVSLVAAYKDIRGLVPKQQLITVMAALKRQYAEWTSDPHLPWLSTQPVRISSASPHSGFITNIGVVEDALRKVWPTELPCAFPGIEVQEMILGHRSAHGTRPLTHVWTLGSMLHLQVQGSDIWDHDYLSKYLDRIVDNVLLLL